MLLTNDVALADLAAPGAVGHATALDQLLEPVEVAAHAPGVQPGGGADGLAEAFRRVRQLKPDAGPLGAERLERDGAACVLAVGARPDDAAVGHLLEDLRVPLSAVAADRGRPVQLRVVELPDIVHALHEERELLELRPLVVRSRDRDVDVDLLLDPLAAVRLGAVQQAEEPVAALRQRQGGGGGPDEGGAGGAAAPPPLLGLPPRLLPVLRR